MEQRQRDLTKWKKGLEDAPLPHNAGISYNCWVEYRETGALPFSGGLLQQAQWVLDDFHYYDMLKEFQSLGYRISDAKRELNKRL